MNNLIVITATVLLMLLLTALYVAGEFATVASRKTRVSQLAATGNRSAQSLLTFLEDSKSLDRYVAACQVGITIVSLILGAYGQNSVAPLLVGPIESGLAAIAPPLAKIGIEINILPLSAAESVAITTILIVFTVSQVVIGELMPKSLAVQQPEKIALLTVWPVKWSLALFRPFIWLFNGSGNLILKFLSLDNRDHNSHVHSPAEIEILVTESHEGGLLDDDERQMLRNAFRMRDLTARQVMVHRTRLVAAPVESSVLDLLNLSMNEGHTRIPLYKNSIDNIMGFVHIKDLFRFYVQNKENLAEILRPTVHVPETMPIATVWETLQDKQQYIAIVFDEYGGTAGLVTVEDLIEEVVGEVQDEFDEENALMSFDSERHRIRLRGDLLVDDVNEYLGLNLPNQDADTLGGLVFQKLSHRPAVGEEATFGQIVIRVETVENMSIGEVSLEIPPSEPFPHIGEWEGVNND